MRRIALLLTAVVGFALVQGCGTTNRNKAVVNKPGQAGSPDSTIGVAPSTASPKGGTTAKPGIKTDGFYGSGGTTQSAATPAPAKKEKPAPVKKEKPAPVKKEVVKAEPKPAPAPAPKKEVAKSTQAEGGTTAKPRAATDGFYGKGGTTQSAATPPPAKKEKPAPVKKEKPAPVKKEVVKAEPKPKPVKETPKKETPVAKPAPAPKPVAKVEPSKPKPAEKKAPVETAVVKPGAKLGMVSQVNNEYKFIVIEFEDENKKLAAGSVIQVVRGGKVVAKAKLEEPLDHWPLATASVIEGTPEKADSVSQ